MHINTCLCLGSFISLAKLYRGNKNVTQNDIFSNILKIVDPHGNCTSVSYNSKGAAIINDQNISNIINCNKGFAIKRDRTEKCEPTCLIAINKTRKLLSPLFDENYKKDFMIALLFTIEYDTLIRNKKRETFEQYFGVYPEEFFLQNEFVFHELLGKTLMYVFGGGIDNRSGKDLLIYLMKKI